MTLMLAGVSRALRFRFEPVWVGAPSDAERSPATTIGLKAAASAASDAVPCEDSCAKPDAGVKMAMAINAVCGNAAPYRCEDSPVAVCAKLDCVFTRNS